MSGLVSAALALYLGLSGPARRSARYVLSKGTGEARERLLEECGRAIARAADLQLADQLAARGEAMGLGASKMSDEAIEKEAVAAVLEARAARCMGSGSERNPRMAARPRR